MEAPKVNFRFFKGVKNQPRQFHINPRTYDPEEEEWDKRVKRIERELAIERGEKVDHEPGMYDFRSSWTKRQHRKSRRKSVNYMLIIILTAMLIGGHFLLQWLEQFE